MTSSIKTTVVFLHPFRLESFNETLPAGEYDIETEVGVTLNLIESDKWTSSVIVHLHPRASHPGLSRELTVPLVALETAIAKDKLSGKALTDYILEEMLADPMICLMMEADGVDEADLRKFYAPQPKGWGMAPPKIHRTTRPEERAGPRSGTQRPGIGE
ncbi:hypothetical protein [Yoonia litorea]|uniref:Uncharacterized protein n=1 Tax=Yoonia litorea TaxID=1123755 RepID=A0A1I6MEI9_9RHOB|nr:hypothetical protein [Yoonia litorea]SFS14007.1 hypothetical protein SAMN05444714_1636 [Yoonia litorea]